MTPAINAAKKANIFYRIHEYQHESSSQSYGEEAAEKMSVATAQVFKTLVVNLDGNELAVGVVPVCSQLNMKRLAKAAGAKKAAMAAVADVVRSTGYVLGGVSPLGQKKRLRTFIDSSAQQHCCIFVSAGRRGLEIELHAEDLKTLSNGSFTSLSD